MQYLRFQATIHDNRNQPRRLSCDLLNIFTHQGKTEKSKLLHCRNQTNWCHLALSQVNDRGFAIVEGVLDADFLSKVRQALYSAQTHIVKVVGADKLKAAGELGVLRLLMKYEPFFFNFLELPELLQIIDETVSPTAVMHLQNGFILPSQKETPKLFQNSFHMDFKRVLNGYMASINLFFAIDEFTPENGATLVVPASHQRIKPPDHDYMTQNAIPVLCPPGSMVIFDSTLWHAAGYNTSGVDRLAVNHQFTSSFIKPQMDYVRALGEETIQKLPERSQQLLGWYTRSPGSLQEYYVPSDRRMYRAGQW